MRSFLPSIALLLLAACGTNGAATDAGALDAARSDGGTARDASGDAASATDAFIPDAGPSDLGASDLGAHDATAPSDATAGTPCGTVVCGDGTQCCSETCSLCGPLGATCPAIACYDAGAAHDAATDGAPSIPACRAMDATGTGTCGHLLGYAFDGTACRAIRGCSCAGPDCASLYTSLATCTATIAPCVSP